MKKLLCRSFWIDHADQFLIGCGIAWAIYLLVVLWAASTGRV